MSRFLGSHSFASAFQRLAALIRGLGIVQTFALLLGTLDDKYLKCFDRRYRVKTSAFILLNTTSFDAKRLKDATQYGPTNAWAVRKILKRLNLSHELRFCDLGSGLGRICILAAEYGFAKTTGVELAAEFCEVARHNLLTCRPPSGKLAPVEILQMDALDYCERSEDDVFFMFHPFSGEFLRQVLDRIAAHGSFRKQSEAVIWGQAFYIFTSGPNPGAHTP